MLKLVLIPALKHLKTTIIYVHNYFESFEFTYWLGIVHVSRSSLTNAATMTRAIIYTCSSIASLASEATEALAFPCFAITDSCIAAFSR